jgi:hypothetical protein
LGRFHLALGSARVRGRSRAHDQPLAIQRHGVIVRDAAIGTMPELQAGERIETGQTVMQFVG